jgi:branched-chain amino acid aminotransferase
MNVFFVLDNCLVTPPLGDTILPGITRASVIEAAPSFGIDCRERPITMQELTEAARSGKLTEAFVCGTAATIVGISEFVFESKESLHLPGPRPITDKFFDYLQGVQYGTEPDVHGWMHPIL